MVESRKLTKLLEQKARIDAQIQQVNARAKQQKRKDETRRKIIAGAIALEHMRQNETSEFAATMRQLLNDHVTKPNERKLLNLTMPENEPK